MKKIITFAFIFSLIISGCGTHAAQGAYTGSQIGSVLGSAIGGLSDGWRGSNVGTIAGLVGGAVVGGAIGNAYDGKSGKKITESRNNRYYDDEDDYRQYKRKNKRQKYYNEDSNDRNYSSHEGDDMYYGSVENNSSNYVNARPSLSSSKKLSLQNIVFYDNDDNGILSGEEQAELVFEIYNNSRNTVYNIVPIIEETSGMKHLYISPNRSIGQIAPGKTIRYTAYVKADRKIKDGFARFRISIYNGSNQLIAPSTEFEVETRR